MRGAIALDSVKTMKAPGNIRIMIIGNNQIFLITFKNPHFFPP